MNDVAVSDRKQSRLDVFMGQVLPPTDRAALREAMPKHVPFERFERNLYNAIMNEPRLLECNPREVFREVAKIAGLGLMIDPQLGEAYLIKSYTGPQVRIGYRGLIKLGRQSGDVTQVYAHEVFDHDAFECTLGDEKKLAHKPDVFSEDRGNVVGYYAVIKYRDGETDFEVMGLKAINKIRDRSDGWKAFKAEKIKDTPWHSSYDEMAKKTCIRRLMKRSPQSPDLATAVKIEDDAEHSDMIPVPRRAIRSTAVVENHLNDDELDADDQAAASDKPKEPDTAVKAAKEPPKEEPQPTANVGPATTQPKEGGDPHNREAESAQSVSRSEADDNKPAAASKPSAAAGDANLFEDAPAKAKESQEMIRATDDLIPSGAWTEKEKKWLSGVARGIGKATSLVPLGEEIDAQRGAASLKSVAVQEAFALMCATARAKLGGK